MSASSGGHGGTKLARAGEPAETLEVGLGSAFGDGEAIQEA